MRIAHVIDSLAPGGTASVALDLAAVQTEMGHDVAIASLMKAEWDDRVTDMAIPLHVGYADMVRTIRAADVTHSHHRRPGALSAGLGRGGRTVDHVHNLFAGKRLLSYRGAAVVAVSSQVAETVVKNYPHTRQRLSVIWNGVSPPPVRNVTAAHAGPVTIAGIGRLTEQKDPLLFVDTIAALRERVPDLRATWYGDGPLREVFIRRCHDADLTSVVALVPWISRTALRTATASCCLLLITSLWEGLPLAALEALAAGTPVVTTPCGDIADVIRRTGAGIAIPNNAEAAACAVAHFLRTADASVRKRAARVYEEKFALLPFAERFHKVYEQVLRSTGAGPSVCVR